MNYKHNPKLTHLAKVLRKNMTREEKHLWYDFLRDYPVRFLRQKVIDNYIADFYCHSANLVIDFTVLVTTPKKDCLKIKSVPKN